MNDLLLLVLAVGPPLVLLGVGIVLLVGIAPNDWSLLVPHWEPSWPHGVQEEEPHPWDLSGVRQPGATGTVGNGPPEVDAGDDADTRDAAPSSREPERRPRAAGSTESREPRRPPAGRWDDPPIRLMPVRAAPHGTAARHRT